MNSKKRAEDEDISFRLSRIEGHVSGIVKMVEDGRPSSEVAHQIAAVRGSLDSLVLLILRNLLSDCSRSAERNGVVSSLEEFERAVTEIKRARFQDLVASRR